MISVTSLLNPLPKTSLCEEAHPGSESSPLPTNSFCGGPQPASGHIQLSTSPPNNKSPPTDVHNPLKTPPLHKESHSASLHSLVAGSSPYDESDRASVLNPLPTSPFQDTSHPAFVLSQLPPTPLCQEPHPTSFLNSQPASSLHNNSHLLSLLTPLPASSVYKEPHLASLLNPCQTPHSLDKTHTVSEVNSFATSSFYREPHPTSALNSSLSSNLHNEPNTEAALNSVPIPSLYKEPYPTSMLNHLSTPSLLNQSGPVSNNSSHTISTDSHPTMKRSKMTKDAPVFETSRSPTGPVRYPPHDVIPSAHPDYNTIMTELRRFKVFPIGRIGESTVRHIPYASDKKRFWEKTGRDSFEIFQYTFRRPNDTRDYAVIWDYNIGLVRITPFFKSCDYSKTTPSKMLDANEGLREISHSITGGSLLAQGYWLPFEAALYVCTTFAYPIRYALVPIFGPDFPRMCQPPGKVSWNKMTIDPQIIRRCGEAVKELRALQFRNRTTATSSEQVFEKEVMRFKKLDEAESGYGTDTTKRESSEFPRTPSPARLTQRKAIERSIPIYYAKSTSSPQSAYLTPKSAKKSNTFFSYKSPLYGDLGKGPPYYSTLPPTLLTNSATTQPASPISDTTTPSDLDSPGEISPPHPPSTTPEGSQLDSLEPATPETVARNKPKHTRHISLEQQSEDDEDSSSPLTCHGTDVWAAEILVALAKADKSLALSKKRTRDDFVTDEEPVRKRRRGSL